MSKSSLSYTLLILTIDIDREERQAWYLMSLLLQVWRMKKFKKKEKKRDKREGRDVFGILISKLFIA